MNDHTNKLIHEKSPYLLQHAHNPVNWYPWSDEAFARARAEGKLVMMSPIRYVVFRRKTQEALTTRIDAFHEEEAG